MEFWQGLMLITSVHLLAAASPGPDFILVSQQTLTHNRRTGLLCSLGITFGLGVHVAYSVLGLAAIIAHSQPLLMAIKWLGGGYLIYLGWQGLKAKKPALTVDDVTSDNESLNPNRACEEVDIKSVSQSNCRDSDDSALSTIRRGFLCNVFNPKAPVYFMAVFTLVLSPDMPLWQLAVYGVWMMVLQMAWFSAVVVLLSIPSVSRRFMSVEHWVNRVLGVAMMALGLNLIFKSR